MEFKDNVIFRPDPSTEFDDAPSLGHVIIKNLTKAGDKTVLVDGITGQKLSAVQLLQKSIAYSKALMAAGVMPGDVVSIVSENRFEFAFVVFGTIFLNCALAPLNHTYSERELEHALNLSKPKIVFVSSTTASSVINVTKSLSYVKKVVLFDDLPINQTNVITHLRFFMNSKILNRFPFVPKSVDKSKTICLIMCSSGTTGLPKGVQLSQSNVIVTTRYAKQSIYSKDNFGDEQIVILGLLPLFHVFGGILMIFTMATATGKIVLLPKFEPTTFLGCIQNYRCNALFLVPPLMVFLAKNKSVDEFDLSSIRFMMCGAAPLSSKTEQLVRDRLKKQKLIIKQGYGMTELTFGVLFQKSIVKPGGVGDPNIGVYAKVIDESGKTLGRNQRGELCFKGSCLMVGYIGDEKATRDTIDEEGWMHTGDVGFYDEDLQFFIVDRIKELIKWKAFQVAPAEIEALLLTHPKIADCGVIGKPDEVAGELPLAFVVKSDPSLTEFEVIHFVKGKTSPARRLHGGVIFVDEIPKNPSGKILRRQLRESLKQLEMKAKL